MGATGLCLRPPLESVGGDMTRQQEQPNAVVVNHDLSQLNIPALI
jgi:hypothetical protein